MNARTWTFLSMALAAVAFAVPVQAQDTVNVVVKVENIVPENGVYFSPVWVGFHDGSFDLFDLGSLAELRIERIAEDGNMEQLRADFAAATAETGGVDGVVTSPGGFELCLSSTPVRPAVWNSRCHRCRIAS